MFFSQSPTPSAFRSEIAITPPPKVDGDSSNGGSHLVKTKLGSPQTHSSEDLYKAKDIVKYKRYESDYTYWLMAKHFSDKTVYGGDMFEEEVTVHGETIKASRWPCTHTYADPVCRFEELGGKTSTPAAGTDDAASNGTQTPEKATLEAVSSCRLQLYNYVDP